MGWFKVITTHSRLLDADIVETKEHLSITCYELEQGELVAIAIDTRHNRAWMCALPGDDPPPTEYYHELARAHQLSLGAEQQSTFVERVQALLIKRRN